MVLLGNNQVNGVDPCRLIKLVHLSTLDLSNNDLLNIPPELGLCTSLRYGAHLNKEAELCTLSCTFSQHVFAFERLHSSTLAPTVSNVNVIEEIDTGAVHHFPCVMPPAF